MMHNIETHIILIILTHENIFSLLAITIKAPGIRKHIIEQKNPPNKEKYDKISSYIQAINAAEVIIENVNIIFLHVLISSEPKNNIKNEDLREL